RDCSGIVCLCLDEATVDALELAPMVKNNQARHGTGFTVTIEAAEGITTGVSAHDRITTIQAALSSSAEQRHIVSPGHVFPLRARNGGVLTRRGHTEGTVDLARLAGLRPAGVLCELMNPDGSMARGEQVALYARENSMPMLTIEELAQYRVALTQMEAVAV
ncbi:3,4-dihydroxy-2-butanone-4-phosphate synthase, partial [Pseudomonas shirazensis]